MLSTRTLSSPSIRSSTSSDAISNSPRKAWATTTVPWPICGERSSTRTRRFRRGCDPFSIVLVAVRKLEERLEQLKRLRSASPDESVAVALRKALQDRSNLLVAEAAKIAGDNHLASLIPDLLAAFDRLFADPANDPKC